MTRYLVETTRTIKFTHITTVEAPTADDAMALADERTPVHHSRFAAFEILDEGKEAHEIPTSHDYPAEVTEDDEPLTWDSPGISEVKQMGRN